MQLVALGGHVFISFPIVIAALRLVLQGIPFGLRLGMKLFRMPLDRQCTEITSESKDSIQNNSISGLNPEGMPCAAAAENESCKIMETGPCLLSVDADNSPW